MPRGRSNNGGAPAGQKQNGAATLGFEAKLWQAADALRNNMDAAEYKHVVLGLIFLKYISDAFEAKHAELAPYTAFQPNDDRRGLPIIKITELKAGVTSQTRFSDVQMPEKYRITKGDVLFSWSGNPDTSIDTFVWSYGGGWLNQHIFRVLPQHQHERAFVLSTLKTLRPVFAEIARNKQTTGLRHVDSGRHETTFRYKTG